MLGAIGVKPTHSAAVSYISRRFDRTQAACPTRLPGASMGFPRPLSARPGLGACAVLGQHRSTQPKALRSAEYEASLTAEVVELAKRYGRYLRVVDPRPAGYQPDADGLFAL